MKRVLFAITLAILLLASIQLQPANLVTANPSIPSDIPPIVSVSELKVNVTISSINEELWAGVDAEYKTGTIHGYGESYQLPKEFPSPTDKSPFITIKVVSDKLEAHYPIPFKATNISVKLNGQEKEWQIENRGYYHLFGSNLPVINWTIQPVPRDFTVTVHYEHPVLETNDAYAYLGRNSLLFPLLPRYGCSDTLYPLYSWFDSPVASFNLKVDPSITQIKPYSIDNVGTLTPITYSNSTNNGDTIIRMKVSQTETIFPYGTVTSFPYGAVIVMNAEPKQEPFQFTLAIFAFALSIAGFALCLLYYHKKHRTQTDGSLSQKTQQSVT
jgi:hypothetical protein